MKKQKMLTATIRRFGFEHKFTITLADMLEKNHLVLATKYFKKIMSLPIDKIKLM